MCSSRKGDGSWQGRKEKPSSWEGTEGRKPLSFEKALGGPGKIPKEERRGLIGARGRKGKTELCGRRPLLLEDILTEKNCEGGLYKLNLGELMHTLF